MGNSPLVCAPHHVIISSRDKAVPRIVYSRDTAGQERYDTITKQYYRRAQVSDFNPMVPSRQTYNTFYVNTVSPNTHYCNILTHLHSERPKEA